MNNDQIPDFVRRQLRDYILFVTRLTTGNAVQSIEEIQFLAIHFITDFDQILNENNLANNERKQIRYALYALVDEIALRFLDSKNKLLWESSPLQVTQIGEYDAGIQLFEDIQVELQKPDASYWLLTIWNIVFALGFNGQYLFENSQKKSELVAMINKKLPNISIPVLTTNRKMRTIYLRSFSIVTWSILLLIFTIILYLVMNKYLINLVSQIQ